MYLSVLRLETFTNKTKTTIKKKYRRNIKSSHSCFSSSVTIHPVISMSLSMSLSYKSTPSPSVVSNSSSVTSVTWQISLSPPLPPSTGQFPRLLVVFRGGDEETVSVTWGSSVRYIVWFWRCPDLLWLEEHPWLPFLSFFLPSFEKDFQVFWNREVIYYNR